MVVSKGGISLKQECKSFSPRLKLLRDFSHASFLHKNGFYLNGNSMEEWFYIKHNTSEGCIKSTNTLFIASENQVPIAFINGILNYLDGNYMFALKDFNEVYSENSNFSPILKWIGNTHLKLGNFEECVEFLSKSIHLFEDPLSYRNRGYCYFKNGDLDSAKSDFILAAEKLPPNEIIETDLCNLYLYQNRPSEAITRCERAIQINPEFPFAYLLRSGWHLADGNLTNARMDIESYERFIEEY
ncbi:MAG: hypothetical protein H7A24_17840 [Leptospiraceae bacterium]|nr:hypothetical protein [Leptospiraceae bacterium]